MYFFFLLMVPVGIFLGLLIAVLTLSGRVRDLRARLEQVALDSEERNKQLTARVYRLEHADRAAAPSEPVKPAPVVFVQPAKAPVAVPVERPPVRPPFGVPDPEIVPPAAVESRPAPAGPSWTERMREGMQGEEWEAVIGGSWMNKIGVAVLVIGIALFIGYSLSHLGPAGRVGVGFAGGFAMLLGGIILEKRARYRIYARGLIGGGWAAVYFTAYAAHAIAAACVITDALLGIVLLFAVSLGMVGHSLRYRSELVTGLAFFLSFVSLALSPLTAFAVVASFVLAISLLYVAHRFEWNKIAVFGLVATYGVYLINAAQARGGSLAAGETVLLLYWTLFEVFDLLDVKRRGEHLGAARLLFPLNAAGAVGISWLQWQAVAPHTLHYLFALAAACYLLSAAARLRIRARSLNGEDCPLPDRFVRGGYEPALTAAAALIAGWSFARLSGNSISYVLLAEAEVLFVAGFLFRERFARQLAEAIFVVPLVKLAAWDASNSVTVPFAGRNWHSWTSIAAWTAALFYLNRVLMRDARKYAYSAAALCVIFLGVELPHEYIGLGWLVLAAILFEIGLRREFPDFRLQSYAAGGLSLVPLALINVLGTGISTPRPQWIPQLLAGLAGCLGAARIFRFEGDTIGDAERRTVFNAASAVGTVMLASYAWTVLPIPVVAVAWAAISLVLIEIGMMLPSPFLRLLGHLMSAVTAGRLFLANFTGTGYTWMISHRLLIVAPIIALHYYLRSRVKDIAGSEGRLSRAYLWGAAVLAAVLLRFELGRVLAVDGWAVLGLVLLFFGVRWNSLDLRYQSYALALLAFGRSWMTNFSAPESFGGTPARVLTGAIVILTFYFGEFVERRGQRARAMFALLGSGLLAVLLYYEVSGSLLTVAWGLEGVALLSAGFPARERTLRLSGLCLLLVCILKLFVYDLREIETPYRILSFIVLGLLLLTVSWAYTQFRERIKRFL